MSKIFRYPRSISGDSLLMSSDIFRGHRKSTKFKSMYNDHDYMDYHDELNSKRDLYNLRKYRDPFEFDFDMKKYDEETELMLEKSRIKDIIKKENEKENSKYSFSTYLIVMFLFSMPLAYYTYDSFPIFTNVISIIFGFFIFKKSLFYVHKVLKHISNKPHKRLKIEIINTKKLLDLIEKETKLTNNLTLSQQMHDQITVNEIIIENIDSLSSIDLIVKNKKLKNALNAIDTNCLKAMKAGL